MKKVKEKKKSQYFSLLGQSYYKPDAITGMLFILPAVILGFIFILLPMAISLGYAFTNADLYKLDQVRITWFENFEQMIGDRVLIQAFKNSMEFAVKVVPLQLFMAVGLALILNTSIKGNTFFRWAFFCPVMLSLAVTSMLWMNLLNEQDGLINALLESVGLSRQKFLNDPEQAMDVIVIMSAWQGAGYQMLIILSALKNIPKSLYEAASLDGAGKWSQFWRITLPSIVPTLSFTLVTMLIGAFRLITQPMIMTNGGPVDSTMTMSFYIYKTGVEYRDVGYSSAIALAYTVFMAIVSFAIRRLLEGKDEDKAEAKARRRIANG